MLLPCPHLSLACSLTFATWLQFTQNGGLNVCSKFRGNPSDSCYDILLKTTSLNLKVALEEESEDAQSHEDSSPTKQECLYQIVPTRWAIVAFCANFQSWSARWSGQVIICLNKRSCLNFTAVGHHAGFSSCQPRWSYSWFSPAEWKSDPKHLEFCFSIMKLGA